MEMEGTVQWKIVSSQGSQPTLHALPRHPQPADSLYLLVKENLDV